MAMLTTSAASNLPASPTLRPTDATSSVATEIDVSSERAGLTPLTTPNFSRPVSAMSSPAIEVPLALSSVTYTRAVSRIASRDVVFLEGTPVKARSESLPLPKDTPLKI
ncbi:uncharacterized protein EI90DRAFT_3118625 [Cantharellus anzutake]|uniref:uncharacterized protein n=1 Tax=Cantharellus anzutake TaxID=1750568 RepID=UPI00190553FD|nr:uncharacterized protein EI90DRAFT_3118625 [Cantharellus anzutake]KAF8338198.1 hypothetical protein EI90DRAFT_3118625 [Cantharellus anzutake]